MAVLEGRLWVGRHQAGAAWFNTSARKEQYKGALRKLGIMVLNATGSGWLRAGLAAGGIACRTSLWLVPGVPHHGAEEAGLAVQFSNSRTGRKLQYFLDVSLNC